MLLPAAREASRRVICMKNVRQTGLVALDYEISVQQWPPGVNDDGNVWRTRGLPIRPRPTNPILGQQIGWGICFLPFAGKNNIFDFLEAETNRWDHNWYEKPGSAGQPIASTIILMFLGPRDDQGQRNEDFTTRISSPPVYRRLLLQLSWPTIVPAGFTNRRILLQPIGNRFRAMPGRHLVN